MKGLAVKRNYGERFVQAIDAIRKDRSLGIKTDTAMGKALNLLPQQINRIRGGYQLPPMEALELLTAKFNINPAFLLSGQLPLFLPSPDDTPEEATRKRVIDIVENDLVEMTGNAASNLFYDKEDGVSFSTYKEFKHGRIKTISFRFKRFLQRAYGVNPKYIETGEGEKFLPVEEVREPETKEFNPTVITVTPDNQDVMVVVPQKAAAHYYEGWADPEFQESLEVMQIPGMPRGKTTRAFPVNGDSMQPRLHNGAYVACFQVDPRKIKEGFIHAVVTADGIVVHRVFKRGDNFRLVPDNPLFRPIDIPIKEVWEIWEVWNAVISDFPPPDDMDAKVNHLQVELLQFKSEVKDEIRETANLVSKIAQKVGV